MLNIGYKFVFAYSLGIETHLDLTISSSMLQRLMFAKFSSKTERSTSSMTFWMSIKAAIKDNAIICIHRCTGLEILGEAETSLPGYREVQAHASAENVAKNRISLLSFPAFLE